MKEGKERQSTDSINYRNDAAPAGAVTTMGAGYGGGLYRILFRREKSGDLIEGVSTE